MTFRTGLVPASAAAIAATMLDIGMTRAHAGEVHAAEALTGSGGAALVAALIVVVAAYWLADRADRRSPDAGRTDQASRRQNAGRADRHLRRNG